jgi:hypothetical protein
MTRESGGSPLLVKIELALVVRPLFYEDHIELRLTELTHTIERFDGNPHFRFAAIVSA